MHRSKRYLQIREMKKPVTITYQTIKHPIFSNHFINFFPFFTPVIRKGAHTPKK